MTSGCLMAWEKMRRNSFGFLPRGVQVIMPMTDRDRQEPVERMAGVRPLGAHVRLTLAR